MKKKYGDPDASTSAHSSSLLLEANERYLSNIKRNGGGVRSMARLQKDPKLDLECGLAVNKKISCVALPEALSPR